MTEYTTPAPLSYELCCQLRDAGFPQNEQCRWFYCSFDQHDPPVIATAAHRSDWISAAECPDLEDLLAYLQAKYPDLCFRQHQWNSNMNLEDGNPRCIASASFGFDSFDRYTASGDTPAEAVARLVIELGAG